MRNNADLGKWIYGLRVEGIKRPFDRTLTSVRSESKKKRRKKKSPINQVQESSVRENHKPWVQHNL
jgi:hypothetical protein